MFFIDDKTEAILAQFLRQFIFKPGDGFFLAAGHKTVTMGVNADEDIAFFNLLIANRRWFLSLRAEKFHRQRLAIIPDDGLNRFFPIVLQIIKSGRNKNFHGV